MLPAKGIKALQIFPLQYRFFQNGIRAVKELPRKGRGGKRLAAPLRGLTHCNVILGFLFQQNRCPRRKALLLNPVETKPLQLAGRFGKLLR